MARSLKPELIPQVAERLKAMAEENRIRLLLLLKAGPRRVGDLSEELGLAQASVSKHLAVLRRAGLVTVQRRGTEAFYRIHDPSVFELCDIVCGGVQRHLKEQMRTFTNGKTSRSSSRRKQRS